MTVAITIALAPGHRLVAQECGKTEAVVDGPGENSAPGRLPAGKDFAAAYASARANKTSGTWRNVLTDFGQDQKQIWTSPSRIRFSDADWLVPLGGIAAGLFVTDRQYSASLPASFSTLRRYNAVSNAGLAGLAGAAAGIFLMSFPSHNEHWRETGLLAGEAALNSLIPVEVMKYTLDRERPDQRNGSGAFFHGGTSFPSEHSAIAWSIAGVIAHEYPGVLPQLMAYGTAAAVDFTRVRGRQHFPSNVFVGGILGYLTAQNVYRRRNEPELGGRTWESPGELASGDRGQSPAFLGSPYVPLDSWIYPALERLAALGAVKTAILGLRPWTHSECRRLLSEAAEEIDSGAGESQQIEAQIEAQRLYASLSEELGGDFESTGDGGQSPHAQLESLYVRTTGIAGKPLTDNEHFGQTILNDYGRPYQEGFNAVAGVSSWAVWGPFVVYGRGEYQSAPSAPAPSAAALGFIASTDGLPPNPLQVPIAAVYRVQLLDAYVGMNLANWQFTFGRQSLWWGPGEQGAMLATNNAEPLDKMFRVSRVSPLHLPSVLGYLGDIRMEFFLGQLAGQEFIHPSNATGTNSSIIGEYGRSLSPQPTLSGGKISFKLTPNFEIGISKTTVYGGPGNPVTLKTLVQSALSLHVNGEALGDGRAALDFSYRIPRLRDWLSFYGDAFQEDEISPLNRPYKSAFQTGLYLAKVPGISRLDLRLEGGTTSPLNFPTCTACYYSNGQYLNGYTNHGELMGTWLGRAAQGEAVRSSYWLGPRKKIGVELRHRKIDPQYLPQGGTQNDVAVNADFLLPSGVRLSGTVQYESWQIPLLAANRQNNLTSSFQIGYWPRERPR
jgi:membrane-associated phospholipid phosphatase